MDPNSDAQAHTADPLTTEPAAQPELCNLYLSSSVTYRHMAEALSAAGNPVKSNTTTLKPLSDHFIPWFSFVPSIPFNLDQVEAMKRPCFKFKLHC